MALLSPYKPNKLRLLIWLLPLAVCIFIFVMSSMDGEASSSLSDSFFMRKAAHITEFTMLMVSLNLAFYVSLMRGKKWVLLSLFLTALYAASDELHQLFVPGRSARVSDVLIDCALPLVLTLLMLIFRRRDGSV